MARKMYPNLNGLDAPRIQFNWGLHDGALDAVDNRTRTAGFCNEHYAAAYGISNAVAKSTGARPKSSEAFWQSYLKSMSAEMREAVYQEQLRCEIGSIENCLRRRADDRMVAEATKRAREVMA
jgi:hypothetical protein